MFASIHCIPTPEDSAAETNNTVGPILVCSQKTIKENLTEFSSIYDMIRIWMLEGVAAYTDPDRSYLQMNADVMLGIDSLSGEELVLDESIQAVTKIWKTCSKMNSKQTKTLSAYEKFQLAETQEGCQNRTRKMDLLGIYIKDNIGYSICYRIPTDKVDIVQVAEMNQAKGAPGALEPKETQKQVSGRGMTGKVDGVPVNVVCNSPANVNLTIYPTIYLPVQIWTTSSTPVMITPSTPYIQINGDAILGVTIAKGTVSMGYKMRQYISTIWNTCGNGTSTKQSIDPIKTANIQALCQAEVKETILFAYMEMGDLIFFLCHTRLDL